MQKSNENLEDLFQNPKRNHQKGSKKKLKREAFGDALVPESYKGPWARFLEAQHHQEPPNSQSSSSSPISCTAKEQFFQLTQASNPLLPLPLHKERSSEGEEYSILHSPYSIHHHHQPDSKQYLFPSNLKNLSQKSTLRLSEHHRQGIQKIRLFPNSGHLLLSCGMEGLMKLWSTDFTAFHPVRSIYGHNSAVKDAAFSPSGEHFVSCSLDATLKIWSTQSGQCKGRLHLLRVPLVVKFLGENEILIGFAVDGTLERYSISDCNAETFSFHLEASYQGHSGSVNAICILPNASAFLTTSNDKSIRIWDLKGGNSCLCHYPIPPSMSPPFSNVICCNSFSNDDNSIACQSVKGKIFHFRVNFSCSSQEKMLEFDEKRQFSLLKSCNKKYISPLIFIQCYVKDSWMLAGGDAEGKLCIWDWEKATVMKNSQISLHQRAITGIEWNSREGTLITSGLDGQITVLKCC